MVLGQRVLEARRQKVGLVSVAGRKLKAIGSPRKENCVPEILL